VEIRTAIDGERGARKKGDRRETFLKKEKKYSYHPL